MGFEEENELRRKLADTQHVVRVLTGELTQAKAENDRLSGEAFLANQSAYKAENYLFGAELNLAGARALNEKLSKKLDRLMDALTEALRELKYHDANSGVIALAEGALKEAK